MGWMPTMQPDVLLFWTVVSLPKSLPLMTDDLIDSIPTSRYGQGGMNHPMTDLPHKSQTKLLDATLKVVRTKGYNATRVEDVCAAAGVTKGSFFHHFESKDD